MAEQLSADAFKYITLGIQSEIAAYVFYKNGSAKVADQKVKETMLRLANEERNHFLKLESHYDRYVRSEMWVTYRDIMSRDGLPDIDESMGQKHVKRLEQVQKAQSTVEILQIALELEKEAHDLYSEALKTATEPDVKETFELLADFEASHIRNVEAMIARAGS